MKRIFVPLFVFGIVSASYGQVDPEARSRTVVLKQELAKQGGALNNLDTRLTAVEGKPAPKTPSSGHDVTARQMALWLAERAFVRDGYTPEAAQAEAARVITGGLGKNARLRELRAYATAYALRDPSKLIGDVERNVNTKIVGLKTDVDALAGRVGKNETTLTEQGTSLGVVETDLKALKYGLKATINDAITAKCVGYYTKADADAAVTKAIFEAVTKLQTDGLMTSAKEVREFVGDALAPYAKGAELAVVLKQTLALTSELIGFVPHVKVDVRGSDDHYRDARIGELTAIENALKAARSPDKPAEATTPSAADDHEHEANLEFDFITQ